VLAVLLLLLLLLLLLHLRLFAKYKQAISM
jgi:hypothetical protein